MTMHHDEITDEQIETLRTEAVAAGDLDQVALCAMAVDGSVWPDDHRGMSGRMAARLASMTQAEARAECARVIAAARAVRS